MRRKIIQHFANMFPQRFLDLPEGVDLAVLADKKSGVAVFDFLEGTASIDGVRHPEMRTGDRYRTWLLKEAEAHGIPFDAFLRASMTVEFEVTNIRIEESFGHTFRSANFGFTCMSELRTDEKSYLIRSCGSKEWGYGNYWQQLFG
ncbi:MAG: hypothetical protein IT473_09970 [Lysobacter sp.]|nr:hypothetical protein [Lysobacter sp.]